MKINKSVFLQISAGLLVIQVVSEVVLDLSVPAFMAVALLSSVSGALVYLSLCEPDGKLKEEKRAEN